MKRISKKATLLKPIAFWRLPEWGAAEPAARLLQISATIDAVAFVFEYLFGVYIQVYLITVCLAWIKGLSFAEVELFGVQRREAVGDHAHSPAGSVRLAAGRPQRVQLGRRCGLVALREGVVGRVDRIRRRDEQLAAGPLRPIGGDDRAQAGQRIDADLGHSSCTMTRNIARNSVQLDRPPSA